MILAVSTSGPVWAVALCDPVEGRPVQLVEISGPRGRPRDLLGTIAEVCRASDVGLGEIAGFAADIGPGSFTSLRAGLSTVRALGWALGKPAAGVASWDAMAHSAAAATGAKRVLCAVRARAEAWYCAESPARAEPCRVLDAAAATDWLRSAARDGPAALAGAGWEDAPLRAAAEALAPAWPNCAASTKWLGWIGPLACRTPVAQWQAAMLLEPSYVAESQAGAAATVARAG